MTIPNFYSEKTRRILSDRFNAIMVSLQLDELINPIKIPKKIKKGTFNKKQVFNLSEIYGDKSRYSNRHSIHFWRS